MLWFFMTGKFMPCEAAAADMNTEIWGRDEVSLWDKNHTYPIVVDDMKGNT